MSLRFSLFNRIIVFLSFVALLHTIPACSQEAIVTFYTHGSRLTLTIPRSKHGIYYGSVWDGDRELLVFQDVGKADRYAIFRLPAGPHAFSARFDYNPPETRALTIDLKPGQQYFIRGQSEMDWVVIDWIQRGRLDEMNCEAAQKELAKAKPLSRKAISTDAVVNWIDRDTLPACAQGSPATQPPPSTKSASPAQ